MNYSIIDFHTHPFTDEEGNICSHKAFCTMSTDTTVTDLKKLGVSMICGSVITPFDKIAPSWEQIRRLNDTALELKVRYGDFYIPGFHVHPDFADESCKEIERMKKLGVKLIGELVPYLHGWSDYSCDAFSQILDVAEQNDMIVSFHSMDDNQMDKMTAAHPNLVLVAAHPGEYGEFMRHMKRMQMSENYYLELSGYGIFRHGMLRHAIDLFGPQRFLYGSDYPTCNPAMYVGGVALDFTLNDKEKRMILHDNAARLLGL